MRKQKIEALRIARTLIKNHKEGFICHALHKVAHDPRLKPAALSLEKYITRALGRHGHLGGWVKHNRPRLKGEYWSDTPFGRKARIQWIDWMIADLQKP